MMASRESTAPARWRRPSSGGGDAEGDGESIVDRKAREGINVLIIDDEDTIRESCASVLSQEGYQVKTESRGDRAQQLVQRRAFDIVLLDLYMHGVGGMKLLEAILETTPDCIVIIMTGNPSVESSLAALKSGAWDYLPKPFSSTQLHVLMGRASHAVLVARESRQRQTSLHMEHGHGNESQVAFLGSSEAFQKALHLAKKVAYTDASVFITGESGTGKEMFAHYIHGQSRRAARPLVALNCAALPETLLESEMFGHVKGAFTGAVKDKPGLLEAAHRGTLFLDELGEMSMTIQAKLLRVLQDGVVRRVGSSSTDAVVDVRFIAATNQEPLQAVEEGKLRRDLYYRLRVVPIHLPPLRARPADIPVLANHFFVRYWQRHREGNTSPPTLSEAALRELKSRSWPGNVRELQNVMEQLVILTDATSEISPADLPPPEDAEGGGWGKGGVGISDSLLEAEYHTARDCLVAEFEQAYLERLIRNSDGNMSEAARRAGVDRTTLYRLMQKHELEKRDLMEGGG